MIGRKNNILSGIVQSRIPPSKLNVLWDDLTSNTLKVYRKTGWTTLGGGGSNPEGTEIDTTDIWKAINNNILNIDIINNKYISLGTQNAKLGGSFTLDKLKTDLNLGSLAYLNTISYNKHLDDSWDNLKNLESTFYWDADLNTLILNGNLAINGNISSNGDSINTELPNYLLGLKINDDTYYGDSYGIADITKVFENFKPEVDLKNYYTKSEVDNKFDNNYYTKSQIDLKFNNIPDVYLSDYYTKSEVDLKLSNNYYTKLQIDNKFDDIDLSLFVEKSTFNTLANTVSSNSSLITENTKSINSNSSEINTIKEILDSEVLIGQTYKEWLEAVAKYINVENSSVVIDTNLFINGDTSSSGDSEVVEVPWLDEQSLKEYLDENKYINSNNISQQYVKGLYSSVDIWGNSFNGTHSISGDLKLGNNNILDDLGNKVVGVGDDIITIYKKLGILEDTIFNKNVAINGDLIVTGVISSNGESNENSVLFGNKVSYTPTLSSGIEIGTLKIDDVEHKLYCKNPSVGVVEDLEILNGKSYTIQNNSTLYLKNNININFKKITPLQVLQPCVVYIYKQASCIIKVYPVASSGIALKTSSGTFNTSSVNLDNFNGLMLIWDNYNKFWQGSII